MERIELEKIADVCRVVGGSKTLGLLSGEKEKLLKAAELVDEVQGWHKAENAVLEYLRCWHGKDLADDCSDLFDNVRGGAVYNGEEDISQWVSQQKDGGE